MSVPALEEIASDRNKVAHGYFRQNPFSGEFDVVVRNVRKQYSAKQLDALAAKTIAAWMALRHAEAFYTFSERRTDGGRTREFHWLDYFP